LRSFVYRSFASALSSPAATKPPLINPPFTIAGRFTSEECAASSDLGFYGRYAASTPQLTLHACLKSIVADRHRSNY